MRKDKDSVWHRWADRERNNVRSRRRRISRERLDTGPRAQERRLQRGAGPSTGQPHRVSLAQRKRMDVGTCVWVPVKSLYSLQVGNASSAGLAWALLQPALPRLFCSRGHLRREERKGSFVGGRRSLLHFPCAHSLHIPGSDFVQLLVQVTFFLGLCFCFPQMPQILPSWCPGEQSFNPRECEHLSVGDDFYPQILGRASRRRCQC